MLYRIPHNNIVILVLSALLLSNSYALKIKPNTDINDIWTDFIAIRDSKDPDKTVTELAEYLKIKFGSLKFRLLYNNITTLNDEDFADHLQRNSKQPFNQLIRIAEQYPHLQKNGFALLLVGATGIKNDLIEFSEDKFKATSANTIRKVINFVLTENKIPDSSYHILSPHDKLRYILENLKYDHNADFFSQFECEPTPKNSYDTYPTFLMTGSFLAFIGTALLTLVQKMCVQNKTR